MKILDRYIAFSILRTSLATLVICTLLIIAVNMFSSMNNYVTNSVDLMTILYLAVLGTPEYLMMASSVSFLFGTTFFLSQLESNNEMIMLLNAGISYRRVCCTVMIMTLIVTLLFSLFSETVLIDASVEHDRLSRELFGQSSTQDSRDISLSDLEGRYIINASYYEESSQRLFDVNVIEVDDNHSLTRRLEASYADYEDGNWVLNEGRIYEVLDDATVSASFFDSCDADELTLQPSMFRNQSRNISTMAISDALDYLSRMKVIDKEVWYSVQTDFYSRLFSPLATFTLVFISLLMNYRFKKNVFLFSIIQSLCTAVVYYVCEMVVTIMCSQAIIAPIFSVIIPNVSTLVLSLIIRLIGSGNA